MSFPSYTESNVELDSLNKILMGAGLAPVPSTRVAGDSDANMALTMFRLTWREYASKGWYCYNKTDAQSFKPDAKGEVILPAPAFKAEVNPTFRSFYRSVPVMRLEPRTNKIMTMARGVKTTDLRPFLPYPELVLDVVWVYPLEHAPQALVDVVVQATLQKFAPMVGVPVPPAQLDMAMADLVDEESDASPPANVFRDNPTLYTWIR